MSLNIYLIVIYFENRLSKFIFAILLFVITSSHGELGYSIGDEINSNIAQQFTLEVFTDIACDAEPDVLLISNKTNNRINQVTYLFKISTNKNIILLNDKFQYLHPRAPPLKIV